MILAKHIIDMIDHWLDTPANSYIGSDYGSNPQHLVLHAQNSNEANKFISKLKKDIPILQTLESNQIVIYSANEGFERKRIYLSVASNVNIDITDRQIQATTQEL